jgi:hypothetical protein
MGRFMDKIQILEAKYTEKTYSLIKRFDYVNKTRWNKNDIWQEFQVQLGHYVFLQMAIDSQICLAEPFRKIKNIGDEYADLLFQAFSFVLYAQISTNSYQIFIDMKSVSVTESLYMLISLSGQICDYLLRSNKKKEPLLSSEDDIIFLNERILMIILLLFSLAEKQSIDLLKEYDKMLIDANHSLDRRSV